MVRSCRKTHLGLGLQSVASFMRKRLKNSDLEGILRTFMAQGLYLSQKMVAANAGASASAVAGAFAGPLDGASGFGQSGIGAKPVLEENPQLDAPDKGGDASDQEVSSAEDGNEEWESQIERLSQLDQEWKDYFSETALPSVRHSKEDDERRQHMFDSLTTSTSFRKSYGIKCVFLIWMNHSTRRRIC